MKRILADLCRTVSSTQVMSNLHCISDHEFFFHFYVKREVGSPLTTTTPHTHRHQSPTYLTHIHSPHLNISPWNGQDGTGAPRGCADRAHRPGVRIWLYWNHRVVGQERGKMLLPVFFQVQIQKMKKDPVQPHRQGLGPLRKLYS